MSRGWIVAALLVAGCDRVFDLELRPAVDAPLVPDVPDVGPDAFPVPACAMSGDVIELPLLADTYLDAGPHGSDPVLKLSNTPQKVLLRVAVSDRLQQIATVEVRLDLVPTAGACGILGGCTLCVFASGMIAGYWVRPDWDEDTANQSIRKQGVPWASPGAVGATDRSTLIAMTMPAGNLILSMPLDPTKLQSAWPQDELGIQISSIGTFTATYASKEIASNSCASNVPAPRVLATCK